jgi:hypothetical protein
MTNPTKDLSEIRSMMEKSSKILSLSGLAGITIGFVALAGAFMAHYILSRFQPGDVANYLLLDAMIVLGVAIALAVFFSSRMAKQKGLPLWGAAARHLVTELSIPLATGGVFCLSLISQGSYWLLPSAMLVFYGLALFTASKYTIVEVRMLGISLLTIGILAAFIDAQGLNLWALGFGIGHIVFGVRVYLTYER